MRAARPFALLVLASCATLGTTGGGGQGLPSSGMGPFRALVDGELAPVAVVPYVLAGATAGYSEPSVVGVSSDPAGTAVWLYAVAHAGAVASIVRTSADDGRSFYGDLADNEDTTHPAHVAPLVLGADQGWEGGSVEGPSALQVGEQTWLYYAGASGGIGLAQSSDGLTFTKVAGPVLAADPGSTWESTPPHAPSVAVFPDGSWHMLYGAGVAIGEATSTDGLTWTRVASNPVLSPSPTVDPSTLAPGDTPPFDEGQVDDPLLAPQTTVDGRLQVRVLYTGYGAPPGTKGRASAIGAAGRYGDAGPLSHQAAPVYTVSRHEKAPAYFEWAGGELLYVGEDDTALSTTTPPSAIAAGFAPATSTLPAPSPFPAAP